MHRVLVGGRLPQGRDASVPTIELDPGAQEIARLNPWSRSLFNNSKIQQILGDAYEVVPTFENDSFSAILHDPPSLALQVNFIPAPSTVNCTASSNAVANSFTTLATLKANPAVQ